MQRVWNSKDLPKKTYPLPGLPTFEMRWFAFQKVKGIYLTSLPKGYLTSVWNQTKLCLVSERSGGFPNLSASSTDGNKHTPQNTEECFEFGGDPSSTGLGRGSQVCCDVMLGGRFFSGGWEDGCDVWVKHIFVVFFAERMLDFDGGYSMQDDFLSFQDIILHGIYIQNIFHMVFIYIYFIYIYIYIYIYRDAFW